jgi:hypothetical protein
MQLRRVAPALLLLLMSLPAAAHAQTNWNSVRLTWTATGDDSLSGTAAQYDLRMAETPITLASWETATAVGGLPAPLPSGTAQHVLVHGISAGSTYYFALRVRDDAGNWSGLSNVVRWDGLDTAPPAAPSGLAVEPVAGGMRVRWEPSTAPNLAGYSVYRATHEAGAFGKLNLDLLTTTEYIDQSPPPGAASLWYEVTATNTSGNESAHSASVEAAPAGQSPAPTSEWRLAPAYPNPSHAGDVVRFPVELAGAGNARLDIVDAAEHLVRRLDLSGLGPGRHEVQWDGRNVAGRLVAPGPYRAWLVAGDLRRGVRVLRVP